jgi:drug/metabolite transporter (DMT)-like permease
MRPEPATSPTDRPGALAAPPRGDVLLMVVAVVAVSTSGPLMAGAAAPALAVAFWRNGAGAVAIAPFALLRHRGEVVGLTRRERVWTAGSGLLLAAHFATWTPSLRMTSVASATALVSTLPIWVALIARLTGHPVPARAWWGIGLSMVAVLLLTGVDFSISGRALAGDLLALAGGVFAALYTVAGAEVRRTVTTTSYTFWCYGTAALALLAGCLVSRQPVWGYSGTTWLQLLGLTAGAQLLGHSVFNRVLRTTSPTVVALALLFEVPGAAAIAAVTLHQHPPAAVIPAAVLLLVGIAVVVSARTRDAPPTFALD